MLPRGLFIIFTGFCLVNAGLNYIPFVSDPTVKVNVYRQLPEYSGAMIVSSFPVGALISHCTVEKASENTPGDYRKLLFRIGVGFVSHNPKTLKWTRCLTKNNGWIYDNAQANCPLFDAPIDFPQIFDLGDEEIIVMVCKNLNDEYIQELYVQDYPKLQVHDLSSNMQRNLSVLPDIYLPHGAKIPCVSNFPGSTNNVWKKMEPLPQPDYSKGQFIIIEINSKEIPADMEQQINEYQCTISYTVNEFQMTISARYKFHVQVNYDVHILDVNGLADRTEFDVGETISCHTKPKAIFPNSIIWYNGTAFVNLYDSPERNVFLQKAEKYLKINDLVQNAPALLYLSCSIECEECGKYIVLNTVIKSLTKKLTIYTSSNENIPLGMFTKMQCQQPADRIYLFTLPAYKLPLSSRLTEARFVSTTNRNKSVSLDINIFVIGERYYVFCQSDLFIYAPVELDISRAKLVHISSIFPKVNILPKTQIPGFVFVCQSELLKFKVEWRCPRCVTAQHQLVEVVNEQKSFLYIISQTDLTITYECIAIDLDRPDSKAVNISLPLKIYAGLNQVIRPPTMFYTLGDPVICLALRITENRCEGVTVMIPAQIEYSSTNSPTEYRSTDVLFDPDNATSWSPRIPTYSEISYKDSNYKFRACCLKYDKLTSSEICIENTDLVVIVNYTFKYNFNIPSEFVYPGNVLKCCVLSQASTQRNKWDGDNKQNCQAAFIVYYANTNRGATPDNPGEIVAEGTKVIVPDTFHSKDITLSASFVKCYTDFIFRKTEDLKQSARQLKIKSCSLSPPPLTLIPADQTLFLVNSTIRCVPTTEECKASLLFNFKVERGGILIDTVNGTTSIILLSSYMGKNIRITCESGTTMVYKDISIERVPHNIEVLGLQRIMTINSIITCTSDGFPEPNIVWTQINGSSLLQVDDYAIIIRNWDRSGYYEFICTAFNKHGESSSNIKFQIFNVNMRDTYFSKTFYIVLYLELFIYHCGLVGIIYFIFQDYLYQSTYPVKIVQKPN